MCDIGSLTESSDRKARKDHKCCECYETIRKGQTYSHVSGLWSGEFLSFKTCGRCEAFSSALVSAGFQGCDEGGYSFGDLYSGAREDWSEEGFPWSEAPEFLLLEKFDSDTEDIDLEFLPGDRAREEMRTYIRNRSEAMLRTFNPCYRYDDPEYKNEQKAKKWLKKYRVTGSRKPDLSYRDQSYGGTL